METSESAIVAGWYPDPADESLARWWDGAGWTTTTRPREPIAPVHAPPPVYPTPYRPVNQFQPLARFEPTRAYTGSVWALATSPVWVSVLVIALFMGLGTLFTPFVMAFTSLVIFIIIVSFAVRDHNELIDSLHPDAASAWWMLLGPMVYLIVRGVYVSRNVGRGWSPLVTYILCSFAPVIAALGFSWFIISLTSGLGGV